MKIISVVTLYMQLKDPIYRQGVYCAAAWYIVGLHYFAFIGRKKLVKSSEEEFAEREQAKALATSWAGAKSYLARLPPAEGGRQCAPLIFAAIPRIPSG